MKSAAMAAIFFASELLFYSPQVSASLMGISGQPYSYDSATRLYWLHPSETLGLSYPAVISGSLYSNGWRYATGQEVNALLRSNLPSLTTAVAADVNGNPFYGGELSDFYAPPQLDVAGETAKLISALGGSTYTWGSGNNAASGMITQFDRIATGGNILSHAVVILAVWPDGNAEAAIAGGAADCCPDGRWGSFLVRTTVDTTPFTLGVSINSLTIAAGQSASTTVTLTPNAGFILPVTFSCTGLPVGAACSFAPPSVTPNGGPDNSILTISTDGGLVALVSPGISQIMFASVLAPFVLIPVGVLVRQRGSDRLLLDIVTGFIIALTLTGMLSCSSSDSPPPPAVNSDGNPPATGTPAGTYNVTVTASFGSGSSSVPVTLTVTR